MEGITKLADFEDQFFKLAKQCATSLLAGSIEKELSSGKDSPQFLKTNFGLLISQVGALNSAKDLVAGIVSGLLDDLRDLLQSQSYTDFVQKLSTLKCVDQLSALPDVVRGVIQMEVGLTLSFVTVINNLHNFDADLFLDSLNQYFFSSAGYKTVSGTLVVPPKLPTAINEINKTIKAETYVRDMARIVAETAGDAAYDLKRRYQQLRARYQAASQNKLITWFDSFGDLAEASLLPVVEGVMQGAFNIQSNPLLAAGIGTFCGTTARKATEHAYLQLLGIV